MAVRANFNPSEAAKPTTGLLNDMRQLHNEMADLLIMFNALCERMEQCAENLRKMNLVNNRSMFQNFFDRGIIPGKLVRFVDTPAKNVVYEVTGMDGEGFFLQRFPNGQEFKLRVLEDNYRCRAMRTIKENSYAVKRLLDENSADEEALPSRKRMHRVMKDNDGEIPEEESYLSAIGDAEAMFAREGNEEVEEDFSSETEGRLESGDDLDR